MNGRRRFQWEAGPAIECGDGEQKKATNEIVGALRVADKVWAGLQLRNLTDESEY